MGNYVPFCFSNMDFSYYNPLNLKLFSRLDLVYGFGFQYRIKFKDFIEIK